jgi:hypothetical protein
VTFLIPSKIGRRKQTVYALKNRSNSIKSQTLSTAKDLRLFLALFAPERKPAQIEGIVKGHDFSRAEKPEKNCGL